jgi:hypothetical protein
MQDDLQSLQQEKQMAEGALSFHDNEKGMAYIQSGKCVLVEGEQAQQFRFKVIRHVYVYIYIYIYERFTCILNIYWYMGQLFRFRAM